MNDPIDTAARLLADQRLAVNTEIARLTCARDRLDDAMRALRGPRLPAPNMVDWMAKANTAMRTADPDEFAWSDPVTLDGPKAEVTPEGPERAAGRRPVVEEPVHQHPAVTAVMAEDSYPTTARKPRVDKTVTCPHCGKESTPGPLALHIRKMHPEAAAVPPAVFDQGPPDDLSDLFDPPAEPEVIATRRESTAAVADRVILGDGLVAQRRPTPGEINRQLRDGRTLRCECGAEHGSIHTLTDHTLAQHERYPTKAEKQAVDPATP